MKKLTPLLLVLLLMASCQKDPDTSKLSGNFLVYTDYDTSENFKDFDTFYIPDRYFAHHIEQNTFVLE